MRAEEMPELIEHYGGDIYGFCRRLTLCREDADDLYQQTFLRAMELCSKIDLNGNPKSYIISIAVRLWQNHRAKTARRERIAPVQSDEDYGECASAQHVDDDVLNRMLCGRLAELVDGLTEKLRVTVLMFYSAQLPLNEIAATLHIPQGTVKSRLSKARTLLKQELEAEGYGEL